MPTSTRCADEWLVRLLTNSGVIDAALGDGVLQDAPPYVSQELLRRGVITKSQLAGALRDKYGLRFEEPKRESLDKMALALVQEKRRYLAGHDGRTLGLGEHDVLAEIVVVDFVALGIHHPHRT